MKILLRIALVFAAIVICMVGIKVGRYKFTNRDGYASVTAAGNITAVPASQYQTKPLTSVAPTTTEPTTVPEIKSPKVQFPGNLILFTSENTTGTPVGSTVDKPDLTSSVFVGDSVSLGFSRYCARAGIMKETVFLTAGSYSVQYALSTDNSDDKGFNHPMYKGSEMPLLKAIATIKPQNIYLCLGINDVAITGVEGTVKNYCKLINSVWETVPEAKIYIVSTTFMVDSAQKTKLNNLNLANLNHNMKQLCTEHDNLEYIDIMSSLQDEKFALSGAYCSDGFIHQSNSAYDIWAEKLGAK